ncbi:MAG: hypothetical protein JRN15_00315 [Nitrososphaerota archaeon]|nr:hypothetical protein [Nitrososphaerota archaeon]
MHRSKRTKSAISPIIATLLLILIAIASGVVLYTYVLGFLGNSTQNSGLTTSTISIDNACTSITATHCNDNGYSITIRNVGTNSIAASGSIQIYFTDVSTSSTATTSCTISSSIAPGSTITCPSGTGVALPSSLSANQGDSIQIKAVMPDGGSAVTSTRLMS